MNWKTTAVLFVLAILVGIAVLLWGGRGTEGGRTRGDFLQGVTSSQVTRLEIADPAGVEIILEKEGPSTWNLVKPMRRVANEYRVGEMLGGLFAARNAPFLRPEDASYDLDRTGLKRPRLTVVLKTVDRKIVLRFGKASPLHEGEVWLRVEGDPKIYLTQKEVLGLFQTDVQRLRGKRLAGFEPHLVDQVVLEEKIPHPRGRFTYETSAMRKRGGERGGWFLEKPFEERLEEAQVESLIGGIRSMVAERFRTLRRPDEFGLDRPDFKVTLRYEDGTAFSFRFGPREADRKRRLVWVEGTDEVAVVEESRFLTSLPRTRNAFRSGRVVTWTEEETKRIEVEYRGVGKVVLAPKMEKLSGVRVRSEIRLWVPSGAKEHEYEKERSTQFGRYLFSLTLLDADSWLGAQPEREKAIGLDPPQVTLRFVLAEGERVLHFALDDAGVAYLKKGWHDELYRVPALYVETLQRLDLNYRSALMWSVSPDEIKGFWWESRTLTRKPESWQIARERDGTGEWRWRFTDQPSLKRKLEVDRIRARSLVAKANYVTALQFLGRDQKTAKKYELDTHLPPGKVYVLYGPTGASRKVLYLSRNLGLRTAPIYYARFEDDPIVFRIENPFVEAILDGVEKRPKPEKGPDHP